MGLPFMGQAQGSYQVLAESLNPTYTGTSDSYSTSLSLVSLGGRTVSASYINDSGFTAYGSVQATLPESVLIVGTDDLEPADDGIVAPGGTITLSIETDAEGNVEYAWMKDGMAIDGAMDSTLVLADVTADDAGSYTVTLSNSAGSITSDPFEVSLLAAPVINVDLTDVEAIAGDSVDYTIDATAEGTVTYQWFKDAVAIADATGDSLSLADVSGEDEGVYTVTVSNEAGSVTSAESTLSVIEAPVILAQPADVVGNVGGEATLMVDARTEGTTTYEWSFDGTPIADSNAATLTVSDLGLDDEGSYTVTISNEAGSVTSDAAMLALVSGDTEVPGALVGSQVVSIGDGSVTYESPWFGEYTVSEDMEFGWVMTDNLGLVFMTSLSTPEEAYIFPLVIGDILYTADGLYPTYAYWFAGSSWIFLGDFNDISTGSIWVYVYATDEWVQYEDIQ